MEELPKLPRGMGSFSQVGDKIVYKKVIELPNGTRVRRSTRGASVKECMKLMSALEKEAIKSVKRQSARTVTSAMLDWLETVKWKELKDASYDRLESTVKNQIATSDLGKLRYQSVTTRDVDKFINGLVAKGLSYSSIKKAYNALNAFYKYQTINDGFTNPVMAAVLPRADRVLKKAKSIEFFDEEDIDAFLQGCEARWGTGKLRFRYSYVIGANIFMGLRIGELLALQWKDVSFEKRTVYVCKTVIERKNRNYDWNDPEGMKAKGIKSVEFVVQNSTKRGKSRYVPLNERARELLQKHWDEYGGEPEDFVMATSSGKVPTIKNVSDEIKGIEKLAGTKVQYCGTHVLRHTCASLYFRNGVPVETICTILGNSREVCEKTYVHFVEEQLRTAAEGIAIQLV